MIVIVGLGALGSHAAQGLRNFPGLKFVDFDRVEPKNTLSQMHGVQGVRANKALALQRLFQALWGIRVEAVPHKVQPDNVATILHGANLVLDCTDNLAARETLRGFCIPSAVPLLHGALSADGSFAQVVWSDLFKPDLESGTGATCEDGANLPFHMMVGSLLAQTAKIFLTEGRRVNYQLTPQSQMKV